MQRPLGTILLFVSPPALFYTAELALPALQFWKAVPASSADGDRRRLAQERPDASREAMAAREHVAEWKARAQAAELRSADQGSAVQGRVQDFGNVSDFGNFLVTNFHRKLMRNASNQKRHETSRIFSEKS